MTDQTTPEPENDNSEAVTGPRPGQTEPFRDEAQSPRDGAVPLDPPSPEDPALSPGTEYQAEAPSQPPAAIGGPGRPPAASHDPSAWAPGDPYSSSPQASGASQPRPVGSVPGQQQTESSRLGSRAVAITATVLGATALVVGGASAAYGAVRDSVVSGSSGLRAESVSGVTALDIDHGFGQLDIRFEGDGSEALLETQGALSERLTLERQGKTLILRSMEDGLPFGDWSWIFGGWDDQRASLTLPESLEGVDIDIDSGAGAVYASGDFGDLDIDNGAGEVQVTGSAETAAVEVGAGHVIFGLRDVDTVTATVAAGGFTGDFTGRPPSEIRLDVSAGGADITVPDEEYDVRQNVSAGDVDTGDLRVSTDARRLIDITIAAGGVELRTNGGTGY